MPEAKAGFLSQLGALYRDYPFAAWATTAVVGGTIIYLALALAAALSGGDEPPIRVKGGSEHFIISYDTWERQQNNDDKNWKAKNRTRGKDALDVVVLYNPGASCRDHYVTADEIKIVYEDSGTTNGVTLKSTGNHIKVTSDKDLTRSTDLKTLSYGTPNQGHISRIEINGNATNPFCTFSAADQFDELLILDW